ncbi:MAG: divalent-cation tolerance protein CutA [Gammaproteobacteria bacterium]
MSTALVCLCTCPSLEVARELAHALVEARVAACVNVLPGVTSVYRWEGDVQEDTEVLLCMKTTSAAYPRLEDLLVRRHPYELPEIVAVPVTTGFPRYLSWLRDAVS